MFSTEVIQISFCCFDRVALPQRSCWGRGNYLFSHSEVPWQVTKKSIHKSSCPPLISNVMAFCVSCVHCTAPDQTYIKSASISWLKRSLLRFIVGQLHLLKSTRRSLFWRNQVGCRCSRQQLKQRLLQMYTTEYICLFLSWLFHCWNREQIPDGCVPIGLC